MRYSSTNICRYLPLSLLLFATITCTQKQETKTILVLATVTHFGLYTGEILKAEGFNHFEMDSLESDHISVEYLKGFDIVVLAQTVPTEEQEQRLTRYVEGGGNLIAFHPDEKLQHLFGLKKIAGPARSGYLAIMDQNAVGRGLIRERLQVHSEVTAYELAGATEIARVYPSRDTLSGIPGIVLNHYGKGHSLAFTYNLPENIVYTRQGNPHSAGLEKDGIHGIRAMDLFTHGFVDTTQNTLNHADEQMRLLTHGIEHLSLRTKPMPRFWYFPDSLKCVVTLNNDGEDSKEAEFLKQFNDVAQHGASMTLYVKEPQYIPAARVVSWMNNGFEISGHPDDTRQAAHPDWQTMDSVYTTLEARLKNLYGIPSMKTITNHWFVWVGHSADGTPNFAAQAEIEALHGVGLDCNYAHYDNGSDQGHFLGAMGTEQGNYTGSGLTMKFANGDGRILDVYQQLNNVYDQQYMEHRDQDGYFNAFRGLTDRSIRDEVYSSISVRAHNNEYFFSEVPLMKMLDYARTNNIPVWAEVTWLEFLQVKDEATFKDIRWSGEQLSFIIHSTRAFSRDLSCLLPYRYNDKRLTAVRMNDDPAQFDVIKIKGFEYARILIRSGASHRIDAQYGSE
ncbi:MAG TPA: hypothetical protein VK658_15760 [Chryseolinea sp.]|nr:hypothetical protein [Chryseolinea sp.]